MRRPAITTPMNNSTASIVSTIKPTGERMGAGKNAKKAGTSVSVREGEGVCLVPCCVWPERIPEGWTAPRPVCGAAAGWLPER